MRLQNLIVVVLMALIPIYGGAQSSYEKGYIVTLKADTVWGQARINPKKEYENFDKVLFKDGKGSQRSYDSDKILAYGYNDVQFVVMEADGENLFFKILEKGPITMYKQMFPGFRMNKLSWETEYYITNKENIKPVVLKEYKIKRQLQLLMEDNPEFINAYDEKRGFDAEETLEIIKKYNNWKITSGT